MKKLASILVAGLMAVMFASCSAGDGSSVLSIEDTPETVDNTKVFMFNLTATHEKVARAYAIKIKTIKGIKYCALFYRDWETDRKSTRLNSSHSAKSRMPSSA